MMRFFCLLILVLVAQPALAHSDHTIGEPAGRFVLVSSLKNSVTITQDGQYRYIKSNGIPDHATGQFPNRNNPNAISAQSHNYRVPLNPGQPGRAKAKEGVVGVALNGVPFEPGTAECYGRSRGERGPMTSCAWREEAIVNGKRQFGLDQSNAHVQQTGAYHYHGAPYALTTTGGYKLVGYAADGYEIVISASNPFSSYRLKSGLRPSGPGGAYDGTYTQDFEYVEGEGHLDEYNGMMIGDKYVYMLTDTFPYVPRCLKGNADPSFERRGGGSGQNSQGRSKRPPPHHGHGGKRPPPRPY